MNPTVAPAPHLRRVGWVITIVSLAAIGFATLTPQPGTAVGSHWCLLCGPLGGVNSVLNVILFVPLGVGLALSGLPAKRGLLAACTLSALIEAAQLLIPGRYSTIGDVLTNTIGGALGFAIGRYAFTLLRPSPRIAFALGVGWSALWLAIQTIAAFGFSPVIPRSEYYGQIARRVGNFEQFRGRVLRASIADVGVSDTRFEDNSEVRELLLNGATVTTTIVPANSTHDIAPIVRVADANENEIVLFAQDSEDLIFGVRTGAAVLRLRPPIFAVAHVFSALSRRDNRLTMDTLTVSGRYSAHELSVSTQTKTRYDRRIPITASLGWTMLLPFQWYIEGTNTELVLSAIWIACLLLPLGYWGAVMTPPSRGGHAKRVRMTAVPVGLVLLYVGLVVAPHVFGVTAAPLSDWLAAATGILLGVTLAPPVSPRRAKG